MFCTSNQNGFWDLRNDPNKMTAEARDACFQAQTLLKHLVGVRILRLELHVQLLNSVMHWSCIYLQRKRWSHSLSRLHNWIQGFSYIPKCRNFQRVNIIFISVSLKRYGTKKKKGTTRERETLMNRRKWREKVMDKWVGDTSSWGLLKAEIKDTENKNDRWQQEMKEWTSWLLRPPTKSEKQLKYQGV